MTMIVNYPTVYLSGVFSMIIYGFLMYTLIFDTFISDVRVGSVKSSVNFTHYKSFELV